MIINSANLSSEKLTSSSWRCGVRQDSAGNGELRFSRQSGRLVEMVDTSFGYIEVTMNGLLLCRSHPMPKEFTGLFECHHFKILRDDPQLDAQFLSELFKIPSMMHAKMILLNLRIFDDVLRMVELSQYNDDTWTVKIRGNSIGFINPEFEGLKIVAEMVRSEYEGRTVSLTQCTSTSHWKSKSKEVTLKDKFTIDADSTCYNCAKRTVEAMFAIEHPGNDAGFDSLPKSTMKPIGTTPDGSLVYAGPTGALDPMSGGPAVTSGSKRYYDGREEVFNGREWIPTSAYVSAVFANPEDEKQWNDFLIARGTFDAS